MDVDNLTDRIANLSPAKRAFLEMKLKEKNRAIGVGPRIARREIAAPTPLSFAQERLWFLDQLEPDSRAYNQPKLVRLEGALDRDALQKAFDAMVARHEVLRTTFDKGGEHPVQIVGECRTVELPMIDISDLTGEKQDAKLQEIVQELSERRFNLSKDLMLRGALLKLSPIEHGLLIVTHHIASDGWSSGILWRELVTLYEAFSRGEPNPLPELEIQYADYSVWQRQRLQGELLETQLSYWKQQLSKLRPLELPTDRARPVIQSYRGAKESYQFSRSLSDALGALSRKEGGTLFMTLLAAFQTLLYRYTGQDDIAVGSPIAGRARPEIEGLIGFFVNMLVLRSDMSSSPSFCELLAQVRKAALGAYEHQDVPFEKLVEVLHPDRDISRSPLFQVMFAFQNIPRQSRDLPGLIVSPVDIKNETAKYDLSLYMWDEPKGLVARLEYNTDLFDVASMKRLLGNFETLLESIVRNPQERISELPLLTEIERQRMLVEWNDTDQKFPTEQLVHRLFEAQVSRSPDSVALVYEDRQLTYGELNARANQLAHYLQKLGVGPEIPIGICMERSWEMVVAVLAVLKAGGTYVPLDPTHPQARLALVLDDASISILLTQRKVIEKFLQLDARVVCIDSDWDAITDESQVNPRTFVEPEGLAYLIYTSGSTGRPKGVEISHRSVVNFLNSMCERPGLTEHDVLLAVTTLSFDIAGLELYLPLSVGARVVLAGTEVVADGQRLRQLIDQSGAAVMQATPATWRLLLEAGWQVGRRFTILCGGEAMSRKFADQLLDRASCLWNMYGPTETTVWSALHHVELGGLVTIGRPIHNTQIHILDKCLNPVPIGVPGELCIGGAGLARGYKNRPDLVAQQFIPNPFSADSGARLYRTGDLGRYHSDGNIEILGRIDHQVKIRGYRIELGEIETVLSRHTAINQVVVADKEIFGDKRLIGYVVAKGDAPPNGAELRDFLRAQVPEYMIPVTFVFLDKLPLTPNGKVDRNRLPAPDGLSDDRGNEFLAPRDAIELQLANAWVDVLGLKSIGVRDNFFELGGHSLLAVRLFSQIEKAFGRKFPLATLFQAPNIEAFANLLRCEGWLPLWSSLVPIQPKGSMPPFFCVHAHGGNVLNFNDLARNLGVDQPFYGLQAQGLDGDRPKHSRVEEMAAHYIAEIRSVQPSGPYFLGGYCFGGKVALEMAYQLRASGEEVALLAMIDAFAPGYPAPLSWTRKRLAQLRHHWRQLAERRFNERLTYLTDRSNAAWKKHKVLVKKGGQKLRKQFGLRQSDEVVPSREKPLAVRPYSGAVYPGRITVFSPMESHSGYLKFEPHMGWNRLAAGGLEVYRVPGKVSGIIAEPYVKELARNLKECITKTAMLSVPDQNLPCLDGADVSRRRHPVSHEAR